MNVLLALADTHTTEQPALTAHVENALADADIAVHAGDFTTPAVHDAVEKQATELIAVQGNSDVAELCDRLPPVRSVEWNGWTLLVTHGHEHDRTSLPLLAREREADLVIVGHTHRPGIEWIGSLPVLNPGSHADPRGGPPTHGVVQFEAGDLVLEIRTTEGETIERERLSGDG